jgi:hypothetical protein
MMPRVVLLAVLTVLGGCGSDGPTSPTGGHDIAAVSLQRRGADTRTFAGQVTGDGGGAGNGVPITTFTMP